jgi:nucleoside-diphosphate-sugar epimerase
MRISSWFRHDVEGTESTVLFEIALFQPFDAPDPSKIHMSSIPLHPIPSGESVLIAGCGYVGCALGVSLAGAGVEVWGIRRDLSALQPGIRGVDCDLLDPVSVDSLPRAYDSLVFCLSAGGRGPLGAYRSVYVEAFRRLLDRCSFRRVIFVSSTGVYGQRRCEWVDERSETKPSIDSGRAMLEAETVALEGEGERIVVRFSGIYGPGRTRLVRMVAEERAVCVRDQPRFLNQIHRDDCAGVLRHLLSVPYSGSLYLATDSAPATRHAVCSWISERAGLPPPEMVSADDPRVKEDLRGNKRCRNDRLLESGYRFLFPSYREGYAELVPLRGPLR